MSCQSCLSSTSFSALIDGSPMEVFQAPKGLRQSDSLSPLFFEMEIEYHSRLTRLVVEEGRLELYINGGVRIESSVAFENPTCIMDI